MPAAARAAPSASGIDVQWDQVDKRKFLTYGSISVFIVRWLLVKTRMQVGRSPSQRVFSTLAQIGRKEGVRALYSGFSVSIFGAVPAQLVYISTYELVKSKVAEGAPLAGLYDEASSSFVSNLVGGATASLTSQFVVVPIDVVAQRLMIQTRDKSQSLFGKSSRPNSAPNTPSPPRPSPSGSSAPQYPHYRSGIHVVRHILSTEGARGLYRGFFSSLFTYMPSSAIWWATNSVARRNLNYAVYGTPSAKEGASRAADDDDDDGSRPYNEYDIPVSVLKRPPADLAVLALSGVAAGFTSAFLTNPLDTIKTRIQTGAGRSLLAVVADLWRQDGAAGFMKGVRARMLSTVPTSTLLIFSYEIVKSLSVKDPS
ncbi:mitochondrial carrier domain-containing protein [Hyaloraphidium curvatum]|nr:mitochondrial carrier domain-containing protein [Hyaloraphidium curvatum]